MEHDTSQPPPYSSQSTEVVRGPDVTYLKTPCGIAKIVAAVSEIITFDTY